jgi:hypothetical protein
MTAIATVVLPSMSSTSDVEKPKKKGKKKFQKMNDINQVDLLSLFFAQYQTFEERFQLRPTTTTYDEDEAVLLEQHVEKMKKKDKGKEKMTEEEEQAAREEEESGEEGLLIDSLHEDEDEDDTSLDLFSDDLHCFDDVFFDDQDEAEAYLDLFDDDVEAAEHYFNHYSLPDLDHYAGLDFDMVETDDDVALENEGEHWERRVVSSKLGGHVVRRHSRSHKKPRVRPGRWVNARDERRRCERVGLVFEQVCAYKANATRGLEYRTIDYQAIRQDVVIPSTSSSSTTSKSATRTTTRSSSSSSTNNGRVPSYEREVTSAIDRGSVVQCGLSAQQLNDLLNRELTPEDYELLLMLDSTVKPKTLSTNLIDSFPSRTVEPGSALVEGDGERCAICMCSFEVGEGVKELPRCQHCFHAECIVQWLSTASTKCPLCGCSLES